MSFFSKLKDRMFKSSSKLEAGLDAIVEDDAATSAVSLPAAPEAAPPAPAPAQD